MKFIIHQVDDLFNVNLFHDLSKITATRAAEIASSFSSAVTSIVEGTHDRTGDLRLFSESQLQTFLERLDKTPESIEGCIHEVVRKYLVSFADSPAICAHDGNFSYDQLFHHVSILTAHLKHLGFGLESVVPVISVKSAWVPVAMIAVLQIGAAFVLMDPSHPAERLDGIVNQVQSKVVIHSPGIPKLRLPTVDSFVEISASSEWYNISAGQDSSPPGDPAAAAYLIFTSGSTGTFKGVIVQHNQFLTSSLAHGQAYGINRKTRMLQFSAFSFDAVIAEILTTFFYGDCVVIPSEEQRMNNLTAAMTDMNVNFALLTPSLIRNFKPENVPTLENLAVAGESLTAEVMNLWAGSLNFFQGYGPTECSVLSSVHLLATDSHPQHLGNTTSCTGWIVHVDDENLLLPFGTVGELLIMGPNVPRGYLNDPEKTAKSFIQQPNWFDKPDFITSLSKSRRIYKSGDLAYFKTDGTLMFVGRLGSQIKLRGQRIEVGEIETRLRQVIWSVDELNDVVVEVICPGGDKSNSQLAAFITMRNGGEMI